MEKYGSSTDLCAGCRMRVLTARPRGSAAPLLRASSRPAACSSSYPSTGTHDRAGNKQKSEAAKPDESFISLSSSADVGYLSYANHSKFPAAAKHKHVHAAVGTSEAHAPKEAVGAEAPASASCGWPLHKRGAAAAASLSGHAGAPAAASWLLGRAQGLSCPLSAAFPGARPHQCPCAPLACVPLHTEQVQASAAY